MPLDRADEVIDEGGSLLSPTPTSAWILVAACWSLLSGQSYAQPASSYDADRLECENAESLALCRETADYLKKKSGIALDCQIGGAYARSMAAALQQPAVLHLLRQTSAGRSLMSKLAGGAARDAVLPAASFGAVAETLAACTNLPLTMVIVNRITEFQQLAAPHPALAAKGFVANGPALTGADQQAVAALSEQVITPAFIAKVPAIIAR